VTHGPIGVGDLLLAWNWTPNTPERKEDDMAELTKRRSASPLAELFDWFESGWPSAMEWRREAAAHTMRIEDRLEPERYTLRAELPGIDPDKDVEITVADGVLTISAERREEKIEKDRTEFHYGSFVRRVTLPKGAKEDALEATYKDGILEVNVPISTDQPSPRTIPVSRVAAE
jgi:HSP20 family molecular chaperone IbpA